MSAATRPTIPLAEPDLSGNEGRYLQECIDTGFVSSVGAFVGRFENAIAAQAGAGGAVAVCTGTTALHLALVVGGVGPGDLVVCPTMTFIATANAISHCGATPWLMDLEPESWGLCPKQLAAALEEETILSDGVRIHKGTGRRVSAVMTVHVLGCPSRLDELSRVCDRFGLPLYADAAAAVGARYHNSPVGAAYVKASTFSFNGNKTITSGGGGAIVSDDADYLARARDLSSTARRGLEYDHYAVAYNYRMTNLQAAVGLAQIERLEHFVKRKRSIQRFYREAFADLDLVTSSPEPADTMSTCWLSAVVVDRGSPADVEAFRARLKAAGIDARPFWKPVHMQQPYEGAPRRDTPAADDLWWRIVTLPCSVNITDEQLDRVVQAVRDFATAAASQ